MEFTYRKTYVVYALLVCMWLCLPSELFSASVYDLRCEYATNPLGVETEQPVFSWKIETKKRGYWQRAYQVQVKDADGVRIVWDSGKVCSDQSVGVRYGGEALLSARAYRWRVRCWGTVDGKTAWSEWQDFSTGLFAEKDWGLSRWIALEKDVADADGERGADKWRMPLFRKAFRAGAKVKRAVAYVCGLGHFDLFINGEKVGNHFLDAGWTMYDREALYVVFDVKDYLREGEKNAVGVMLGNGFYNIPRERYYKLLASYGVPKLRMLLRVEYEDGSEEDVVTDGTWKATASPVTYSSIYGGEDYDATMECEGWKMADYDDAAWRAAEIVSYDGSLHAQTADPVVVRKEIPVAAKFKNRNGQWVYDLGQNFSGIVSVKVKADRGQKIVIRPAELLNPDSTVNQSATGKPYYFSYTAKGGGGTEQWQPQFTYYGFRYVQIEGAVPQGEDNPDGLPVLCELKGLHTCNDAAEAGRFECSNTLFNQIHTLIDWAVRSNMQSVLTDCPHREKLGWIEQAHLMQPSIMYRYDLQRLYHKILDDMEASQRSDGCIPSITPEYVRFADGFEDSPEWGSAFIISPWYIYQTYGDLSLVRKHYPAMKRYIDYLMSKAKDGIVAYGLGDWYDIGPSRPGYAQLTSNGVTATAIYYYDVTLMAKMAEVLGFKDDVAMYNNLSLSIKEAFRKAFVQTSPFKIENDSQTANAIAAFTGILDEDEQMLALRNLVNDIQGRGNALTAGDIGYRYVLATLAQGGRSDVVFDMNSRSDVPGYGWQLAHGATALTESWQAYGFVSNNHFMLGHLMEWLYAWLGGIRQQDSSVGFRKLLIAPQIVGDVTFAHTEYETPYGTAVCDWQLSSDRNKLTMKVTVPPNSSALVFLPSADGTTESKEIGSGTYTYER